ncbi:MAG: glycosyltransferase [Magnetococcales bacterium]|nr:glycosyltransferase [Magnetococcales bacterium]
MSVDQYCQRALSVSDGNGIDPVGEAPGGSRVALLIPIHNGLAFTQKTLAGLAERLFQGGDFERRVVVVVIDDGSSDGSADWIRLWYPQVHLLHGDGSLWWSGSINLGARYALERLRVDWLLLWNNDILCHEDYFQRLFDLLVCPDPWCLIGSKLMFLEPPDVIFSMGCRFDSHTARSRLLGSGQKDGTDFAQPIEVDWVGGMGTVVHRRVVERIGYWDERRFPQYAGDADFCLRAGKAGCRIRVEPGLVIWNDTSSSGLPHRNRFDLFFRSFADRKSWFHLPTQIYWVLRHGQSLNAWIHLLRLYAGYVGGFVYWKVLGTLGLCREKKRNPSPWRGRWFREGAYFLLGLRLFLYNKLFNRLPFAIVRRWVHRLYLIQGEGSNILSGVEFLYSGLDRNKIRIGRNSVIGNRVVLDGRGGAIIIGDCVDIARECALFTLQHEPDDDHHGVRGGDVVIEDHVWIAARVTVLPGVTIGRGAVVATNSVVTRNVEPMAIVAGNPARKIGIRRSKLDYVLNYFPYFQ